MNNVTEFLSKLITNGNAKLLVKINDTKYMSYAILVNDLGEILANVSIINYSEPLVDKNNQIKENLKPLSVFSIDDPSEKFIYITIAKVIASNYQNEEVIIKSDNLNYDYSIFSLDFIYNIPLEMMMISNHDLICAKCTGEYKYLDNYLTKIFFNKSNERDLNTHSLEEVKLMEDYLTKRVNMINTVASKITTLSGREYYQEADKWIALYDDRQECSIKSLTMNK